MPHKKKFSRHEARRLRAAGMSYKQLAEALAPQGETLTPQAVRVAICPKAAETKRRVSRAEYQRRSSDPEWMEKRRKAWERWKQERSTK